METHAQWLTLKALGEHRTEDEASWPPGKIASAEPVLF